MDLEKIPQYCDRSDMKVDPQIVNPVHLYRNLTCKPDLDNASVGKYTGLQVLSTYSTQYYRSTSLIKAASFKAEPMMN